MKELHALQIEFLSYIQGKDSRINELILSPKIGSLEKRLSIYTKQYHATMLNDLKSSYSLLEKYIGKEEFEKMSNAYLEAFPPHSSSASEGHEGENHLADFLAKAPSYSRSFPHLSDLAAFIWLLVISTNSATGERLEATELNRIFPNCSQPIKIIPHPSALLFTTYWNTIDIWEALHNNVIPPSPLETFYQKNYLIWRHDELETTFINLTDQEAWLFKRLQLGMLLANASEGLQKWMLEKEIDGFCFNLINKLAKLKVLSRIS